VGSPEARGNLRILLVTLHYPPEPVGDATVTGWLAHAFAQHGHEVTVLTAVPHFTWGRILDTYKGRVVATERGPLCRIVRTWVFPSRKGKTFLRLVTGVTFLVMGLFAALIGAIPKPDVIYVFGYPPTNGLLGLILSRCWGVPYEYNVQDLYPDALVALGALSNPTALRLLARIEMWYYRTAAHVLVIADSFRRSLVSRGVAPEKVRVIPNPVDLAAIRPMGQDNSYRAGLGLDGKFVVMYAGNLGWSQGLEVVLAAADLLRHLHEIAFVLVGEGAARNALVEQIEKSQLTNVMVRPFEPYELLPTVLATADVHLVTLRRGLGWGTVPSKLYPILASARPVVVAVDEGCETWADVRAADAGICVQPENAHALAGAIEALFRDPARRQRFGSNGRRYAVEHRSIAAVATEYEAAFRAAVSRESA
jgi:colanic acid biosynthesis glycosyl transferase WcaI